MANVNHRYCTSAYTLHAFMPSAEYTGLYTLHRHDKPHCKRVKKHASWHDVHGANSNTLHAAALSAPFACHAKQCGFLFDDCAGKAPNLVC